MRSSLGKPALSIYRSEWFEELACLRKTVMSRSFNEALSQIGSDHEEISSQTKFYDPIEYLGNILAWIHQSAASEVELFLQLITNDKLDKHGFEQEDGKNVRMDPRFLSSLYQKCFENVCRPFKVRPLEFRFLCISFALRSIVVKSRANSGQHE